MITSPSRVTTSRARLQVITSREPPWDSWRFSFSPSRSCSARMVKRSANSPARFASACIHSRSPMIFPSGFMPSFKPSSPPETIGAILIRYGRPVLRLVGNHEFGSFQCLTAESGFDLRQRKNRRRAFRRLPEPRENQADTTGLHGSEAQWHRIQARRFHSLPGLFHQQVPCPLRLIPGVDPHLRRKAGRIRIGPEKAAYRIEPYLIDLPRPGPVEPHRDRELGYLLRQTAVSDESMREGNFR